VTNQVSINTKAVLLLTAPLLLGRRSDACDVLTAGEYRRLCLRLIELNRQPADLLTSEGDSLLDSLDQEMPRARMQALLGRGLQLAKAIERWAAMSIWVRSRADEGYPRVWKQKLRDLAPPVLYGCGPVEMVDGTGIAVVGSRAANPAALAFAEGVGTLAARSGITVVSGSARGVDRAAMDAAAAAGGKVLGVLADDLESEVLRPSHRELLRSGRLALVSAMDPKAGFNVGTTMQRNKLIYASASIGLVVCSDINKGGTWAGAVEQLERLRSVPIFVAEGLEPSKSLDALKKKGALAWPRPTDSSAFRAICSNTPVAAVAERMTLKEPSLFEGREPSPPLVYSQRPNFSRDDQPSPAAPTELGVTSEPQTTPHAESRPHAKKLFEKATASIVKLLRTPMTVQEVADELEILPPQAEAWLEKLLRQDLIQRTGPSFQVVRKKPARDAPRKSGRSGTPKTPKVA
jgi:DNA processing protein